MKKIKLDIRRKEIPGKEQRYALVDDEDFDRLSRYNWSSICNKKKTVDNTYYAYRAKKLSNGKKTFITMHREIMKVSSNANIHVDHADHDGLNNQKYNLRKCTHRQNMMNMRTYHKSKTSKYKGVSWNKFTKKWRVKINPEAQKSIWLGQSFVDEIEAAKIYDAGASILYKEFAYFNFGKPSKEYLAKANKIIDGVLNRNYASNYRGVTFEKARNKYRAKITVESKIIRLGSFTEEKEAAEAYNKKALELLGDKAILNKIT